MGILGEMKDKLGFGEAPSWEQDVQDDDVQDELDDATQNNGQYLSSRPSASASPAHPSFSHEYDPVSFDAYNPDNFENVKVSTDHDLKVIPSSGHAHSNSINTRLDTLRRDRSSSSARYRPRRPRSHSSSHAISNDSEIPATWETPKDPAFLDASGSGHASEPSSHKSSGTDSDPQQQFDSDIKQLGRNPATHMSIIQPKIYGDVEKIATAAKAGKTVVIVLKLTKADLIRRILDFSFGVASALNQKVEKASESVYAISKNEEVLSEAERRYLAKRGIL